MKKKLTERVPAIETPACAGRLPRLLSARDLPGITGGSDGPTPVKVPQE